MGGGAEGGTLVRAFGSPVWRSVILAVAGEIRLYKNVESALLSVTQTPDAGPGKPSNLPQAGRRRFITPSTKLRIDVADGELSKNDILLYLA